MAWFDIAAGLAQGAQQGIDRVQADQVRRKADAFKDAQEKRALAAEARIVEQDTERKIAEFIERSDPNSLDPVEVQKFGGAAQRYIQKTSDGRLVPRESPLKAKKRAYDTMVLDDAPKDLISKQLGRDAGDATIKEKNAAMLTAANPAAIAKLSDPERIRVAKILGYDDQATISMLTSPGQRAYRSNMPGVAAAEAQGRITLAGQAVAERNATLRAETQLAIETLRDSRATAATKQAAVARYLTAAKDLEPAEREAGLNQMLSMAFGKSPASPSTALTPEQDKIANDLLKKYGG